MGTALAADTEQSPGGQSLTLLRYNPFVAIEVTFNAYHVDGNFVRNFSFKGSYCLRDSSISSADSTRNRKQKF